ncbi:MAG: trypsin-like peptidase domain-containing protein, partial [Bacteroidota bacterium]|nr:trypsin-like peptidase domain-containing protein [Bacteroidota bacterium]
MKKLSEIINTETTDSKQNQISNDNKNNESSLLDAYSQAVISATQKVSPAVVQVKGTNIKTQPAGRNNTNSGNGSGFIISNDGLIVTNSHVLSEIKDIEIALQDGRVFKAIIKGNDPASDLAVLKINALNLTIAHFGDSSKLKAGQLVIANCNNQ